MTKYPRPWRSIPSRKTKQGHANVVGKMMFLIQSVRHVAIWIIVISSSWGWNVKPFHLRTLPDFHMLEKLYQMHFTLYTNLNINLWLRHYMELMQWRKYSFDDNIILQYYKRHTGQENKGDLQPLRVPCWGNLVEYSRDLDFMISIPRPDFVNEMTNGHGCENNACAKKNFGLFWAWKLQSSIYSLLLTLPYLY